VRGERQRQTNRETDREARKETESRERIKESRVAREHTIGANVHAKYQQKNTPYPYVAEKLKWICRTFEQNQNSI